MKEQEVTEVEGGWQRYAEPLVVDATSAAGLAPGRGSPEDAVVHLYASFVRGDARFREALPAPPSDVLERKLARVAGWRWDRVSLLERKPRSRGRWYVRVRSEVTIDGKADAAVNEVSVEPDGEGGYLVVRFPT